MSESAIKRRTKILSIATIILGVLAMGTPYAAGESMLMVIGILIAIAGVVRMIWALKSPTPGKGFSKVLLGVLTIFAGGAIMAHPLMASGILSILLAGYLVFDGIVEVIVALTLEGQPGRGWLFISGFLSLGLGGLMFMQTPFSGVYAIGVLLGIKLIVVGIASLSLGTTPLSYMQHTNPS